MNVMIDSQLRQDYQITVSVVFADECSTVAMIMSPAQAGWFSSALVSSSREQMVICGELVEIDTDLTERGKLVFVSVKGSTMVIPRRLAREIAGLVMRQANLRTRKSHACTVAVFGEIERTAVYGKGK